MDEVMLTKRGIMYRAKILSSHSTLKDEWIKVIHLNHHDVVKGDVVEFISQVKQNQDLGNVGQFDYKNENILNNIRGMAFVSSQSHFKVIQRNGGLLNQINQLKLDYKERLEFYLSPIHFEWMYPMLTGQGGVLTHETKRVFKKAGLLHALVVSGMHLVVFVMFLEFIGLWMYKKSNWMMLNFPMHLFKSVVQGFAVSVFLLFVTNSIPTIRAVVFLLYMCLINVFAIRVKKIEMFLILLMMFVFFNPMFVFSVSFALSFCAVCGIFYSHQWFQKRVENKNIKAKLLIQMLCISLGAFVFTAPVLIYCFQRVSFVSIVSNVLLGFLMNALLCMGWSVLLFQGKIQCVGDYIICVIDQICDPVLLVVTWLSQMPFSHVWVSRYVVPVILLAVLIHFLLLKEKQKAKCVLWSMVILVSFAINHRHKLSLENKINFISVGQGDAAVIHLDFKSAVVVDSGGGYDQSNKGYQVLMPWLDYHGVDQINKLIVSHPDLDHMGGAFGLINMIKVKELWLAKNIDHLRQKQLISLAKQKDIDIIKVASNLEIKDGLYNYAIMQQKDIDQNINNRSLVLKLSYKDKCILFSGDIEKEAELALIKQYDLRCMALKVPHHGSQTSSSMDFIENVNPKYAIVSVGKNNMYRHPHAKVVQRYEQLGVKVFRTDVCGQIILDFNQRENKMIKSKKCV